MDCWLTHDGLFPGVLCCFKLWAHLWRSYKSRTPEYPGWRMCPSSVLSPFSWVQILCDPMDCSPPGSSVHGILQARILEWVAMPSSRGSSRPRDWTWVSSVSSTGRRILYHSHHLGASVIPEWSTEWSALLLPGILVTSLSRPIFTVLNFLTWSFTVHMFFGLNFKLLWSQLIINLQREMAFLFCWEARQSQRRLLVPQSWWEDFPACPSLLHSGRALKKVQVDLCPPSFTWVHSWTLSHMS